jgi:protocatechuate 3,4-dioxygenase beta subunit
MPHHDEHDDRHDRGLAYDLATLRGRTLPAPARIERRRALQIFGGAGLGLLLVACGDDSSESSTASTAGPTTTTTGATATTGVATTTTAASSGETTVTEAVPEETAGPYPGDGSNGPNVLTEIGIVRTDIRPSFGPYSGTAEGVALSIALKVVSAGSGDPLPGAAVYVWHCDREGRYSLYSQGVTDQNYLRGVQVADDAGSLGFTSIYPGAYLGRWPHIHFEVFSSLDDATSGSGAMTTSQIALLEDVSADVYAGASGYSQSVTNLARTSLDSDMVFRDGASLQLPTMSGDIDAGIALALTFAV